MKSAIKKLTPSWALNFYHKTLALLGHYWYGRPSHKMVIVGVTGTKGKSTTVNLISHLLEQAGTKTGFTTTANFKVGGKTWINSKKQTMLGRFQLQKLLAGMVKAGAKVAVIETSSEGMLQSRHRGIAYDILVFTNLTPEHIEAHGSFENYKKTKLSLFKSLRDTKHKSGVKKTAIINLDDKHAPDFARFWAEEHIGFGIEMNERFEGIDRLVYGENIAEDAEGSQLDIVCKNKKSPARLNLLGRFNIYNALAAVSVGVARGIDLQKLTDALAVFPGMPGRMEEIKASEAAEAAEAPGANNSRGFRVFVDYAHEPESLKQVLQTARKIAENRVLLLTGAAGGGRDKKKRPVLGKLGAQLADLVVVANEDPYDEDPQSIIEQVAKGAEAGGKILDQDLFKTLDRKQAIKFIIKKAQPGDVVLITGKGAEQGIVTKNMRQIPHDDRQVAKEWLESQVAR